MYCMLFLCIYQMNGCKPQISGHRSSTCIFGNTAVMAWLKRRIPLLATETNALSMKLNLRSSRSSCCHQRCPWMKLLNMQYHCTHVICVGHTKCSWCLQNKNKNLYNTIQYKKHLYAPFPKGSERLQKTLKLHDKNTM